MKKSTLLKLALMFVAIFIFAGAQAQTNTGATQWTVNGTINEYTNAVGNKVTANKVMPFWVWPSAAYNPNFNFAIGAYATPATIATNVTSSFVWAATSGTTATVVPFQTGAPLKDRNYATISWPLADAGTTQTITVTETPASGVCPATAVTYSVDVIGVPDVTISVVVPGPGVPTLGLPNVIKTTCWGILGDNSTRIPITVNSTDEVNPYAFYMFYKVYTVDGLDGSGNVPILAGNLDPAGAGVTLLADDGKVVGVGGGTPNITTNPVTSSAAFVLPAVIDFESKTAGTKITVYEFDLAGYNAKVSRTSDYIAKAITTNAIRDNWGTYSQYGTAAKYYIIALPKPVTGPIYHISNTFAL